METNETTYKPMVENFTFMNTDFGGRWHGADGDTGDTSGGGSLLNKIESSSIFKNVENKIEGVAGKTAGKPDTTKTPANLNPPKSETTILGMHPMTLVLSTVVLLIGVGVVAIGLRVAKGKKGAI